MKPSTDSVQRRLGLDVTAPHVCAFVLKGGMERAKGCAGRLGRWRVLYVCVAPGKPKCGRRRWERVG